ncbi:ATP-binding protein [Beutenbergia cavernae]|nr:ATP-binding protein [Beutenbergia cavernae]
MWLMVGLPGAGKTTRARALEREHAALRLTPDEWAMALLGTLQIGDLRDTLEGFLLDLAVPALTAGTNVVVDFGLWGRDERSALRWIAQQCGSPCVVEYRPVGAAEQRERVGARVRSDPSQELLTDAELDAGRAVFEEPDGAELDGGAVPPPPEGYESWGRWAAVRWPGLRVVGTHA